MNYLINRKLIFKPSSTITKSIIDFFLALGITILVLRPIDSFDIWWHLNSGLWMLEHTQVLKQDLWSFTQYGSKWTNIAWLFQVSIALIYKIGGIWGLFLFKGLCLLLAFLIVIKSTEKSEKVFPFFISFLVLFPTLYGHLHLRPHLFELISLVSIVWISQNPLNKNKLLLVFFILLVWANSHASVITGVIAFIFQIMLGKWEKPTPLTRRIFYSILFFSVLIITPFGTDLFSILFAHGNSDFIQYYIYEWLPHDIYPIALWVSLTLIFISLLAKKIQTTPVELFLILFFFYFSIKYQRFELEFSLLLLKPLSETIEFGVNFLKSQSPKYPVLASILIILLYGLVFPKHIEYLLPTKYANSPYDKYKYPYVAVAELRKLSDFLKRPLKIINYYDYGGYISLFTNNTSRVYIDGRMSTVFPEYLLLPQYENNPHLLKQLVDKYNADAIVLNLDKAGLVSRKLTKWTMVAYDQASVLFIKQNVQEESGLQVINYDPTIYNNNFNDNQLIENIDATLKLLDIEPENPIALNHMAVFLTAKDTADSDKQKAFKYLEQSIQLYPDNIFSRATYAYLLATTNEKSLINKFLQMLPEANKLSPGISLSYDLAYARTLINIGFPGVALDYLYPINKQRRYDLDRMIDTWELRSLAHISLNEKEKAKNCLDIAYEIIDINDSVKKQNLDNLRLMLTRSVIK